MAKKHKRHLGRCWRRLIQEAVQARPILAVYFLIFTLFGGILPLLNAQMLKVAMRVFARNAGMRSFLLVVGLFSLALLFASGLKLFCQFKADSLMTYVRMTFSNRLGAKLMGIPFSKLEDDGFLTCHHKAFSSLESSGTGVEKVCNVTFYLGAELLSLVSLSLLFVPISFWLPALLLLYSGWRVWVKLLSEQARIAAKVPLSRQERGIAYALDICADSKANRELRLYQAAGLLNRKVSEALKKIQALLDSIRKKEVQNGIVCSVGLAGLLVLLCLSTSKAFLAGHIDVPDVAMFLSAALSILAITEHTAEECGAFVSELDCVAVLYEFLDDQSMDGTPLGGLEQTSSEAMLSVEHLSFRYPNGTDYALKDVNMTIFSGERVAIVGLNGAGKSTLMKCLTGIYDNYEGQIKVAGRELKTIAHTDLYHQMGALFQDICLYAFPLQENIASSAAHIDVERVKLCLQEMGLADRLPNESLEDEVLKVMDSRGIVLSGGESQRIAFARILYKNPDIIFLDEPTSGMDTLAEEAVLARIEALTQGKTILCVTHRLPSIQHFDRIIVLDQSEVTEAGRHEELMKNHGTYYELYTAQSNYYEEDPQ